jgi:hypothetical protein
MLEGRAGQRKARTTEQLLRTEARDRQIVGEGSTTDRAGHPGLTIAHAI